MLLRLVVPLPLTWTKRKVERKGKPSESFLLGYFLLSFFLFPFFSSVFSLFLFLSFSFLFSPSPSLFPSLSSWSTTVAIVSTTTVVEMFLSIVLL